MELLLIPLVMAASVVLDIWSADEDADDEYDDD